MNPLRPVLPGVPGDLLVFTRQASPFGNAGSSRTQARSKMVLHQTIRHLLQTALP